MGAITEDVVDATGISGLLCLTALLARCGYIAGDTKPGLCIEPSAEIALLFWFADPDLIAGQPATGATLPLFLLPDDGPLTIRGEPVGLAFLCYAPSEEGEGDSSSGAVVNLSSDARRTTVLLTDFGITTPERLARTAPS